MKPVWYCDLRQTFTNVELETPAWMRRLSWGAKHLNSLEGKGTDLSVESLEKFRWAITHPDLNSLALWIYSLIFGYRKWWGT